MRNSLFALAALLAAVLLCISCAKPPTDEMNRAVEALSRAENDVGAVTYAANTLSRARDALAKMQEEAANKRFDSAKIFAADVVSLSERAIAEGQTGEARAREAAINAVTGLDSSIVQTESSLNEARAHELELDFNALGADLDSAKDSYSSAAAGISEGNFLDAVEYGQATRSTLSDINSAINEGVQAILPKK